MYFLFNYFVVNSYSIPAAQGISYKKLLTDFRLRKQPGRGAEEHRQFGILKSLCFRRFHRIFLHLFPGTSLGGGGVSSIVEDLLLLCLPSSLHFTILNSGASEGILKERNSAKFHKSDRTPDRKKVKYSIQEQWDW